MLVQCPPVANSVGMAVEMPAVIHLAAFNEETRPLFGQLGFPSHHFARHCRWHLLVGRPLNVFALGRRVWLFFGKQSVVSSRCAELPF